MAPCSAGLSLGRLCDMVATADHSLIILTCCIAMPRRMRPVGCWRCCSRPCIRSPRSAARRVQSHDTHVGTRARTHTYSVRPPFPTAPRQRTGCANTCCIQPMSCLSRVAAILEIPSTFPCEGVPLPLNQTPATWSTRPHLRLKRPMHAWLARRKSISSRPNSPQLLHP